MLSPPPPVLTRARALSLLALPEGPSRFSFDLGISSLEVIVSQRDFQVEGGWLLPKEEVLGMTLRGDGVVGVWEEGVFVPAVDGVCQLVATEGAPSLMISGVWMLRVAGVAPNEDGARRARAVVRTGDRVLDCCTGLGYAAMEALLRGASQVVTVEANPSCSRLLERNPWSRPLLESRAVKRVVARVEEWIEDVPDGSFDVVIHDPPRFSLAGELYSGLFYRQVSRVLGRGGRLSHYTGDPGRGRTRFKEGVARRLGEAGFSGVTWDDLVDGFVARKG